MLEVLSHFSLSLAEQMEWGAHLVWDRGAGLVLAQQSWGWRVPCSQHGALWREARGSLELVTAGIEEQLAAGRLEKGHFCSTWGRSPVLGEGGTGRGASAHSDGLHHQGERNVSNGTSMVAGSPAVMRGCADPDGARAVLAALLTC